jgi:hypothetical protein
MLPVWACAATGRTAVARNRSDDTSIRRRSGIINNLPIVDSPQRITTFHAAVVVFTRRSHHGLLE